MLDALRAVKNDLTAEGAMFATIEAEVKGIPMRVYANAASSMRDLWVMSAAHGDKPYLVYEDERYSYADIHRQVRVLAHALVHDFDVKPGDRVAVSMRNYPEWIVSYWATVSVGAAVVGMNAWWTGEEMEYGLLDSVPSVVICDDERLQRLLPHLDTVRAACRADLIVVRHDGDLPSASTRWDDVVVDTDDPPQLPAVNIDTDSDACIFYTSGTTGRPKGAQLTHRGCVHNIMNIAYWNAAMKEAGARSPEQAVGTTGEGAPATSFLLAVPLFHVTGCNCVLHPITLVGGKIVMMYKWNPERALELVESEQITNMTGVPTMSREMLMSPDFDKRDTSSLVSMGGGGAPLQPDLVEKIDQKLERGAPGVGYGMTETCGVITMNSAKLFLDKPATVGPILPVLDGRIVDEEGNDVPAGERGELWVKGPVVISGYLNRAEATAESITDGWLHTGDVAVLDDDGFIAIVDRAKDMIIRGGENIGCAEIETVIYEHPDVREVAVFGKPDDRLGEIPVAAVVVADDTSLEAGELQELVRNQLASYKVPEEIYFLDQPLPRNANGKFLKRQLRDDLLSDAT